MKTIRLALVALSLLPVTLPAADFDFVFADSSESHYAQAWRTYELKLRDPHVFVDASVFGCVDFTDEPIPVVGVSLNGEIEAALTSDGDGDGLLDLNAMTLTDRLNPQGAGQMVTAAQGECPAPDPPVLCQLVAPLPPASPSSNTAGKSCLGPVPGTTSGYVPAVPAIGPPCFKTDAGDSEFMLDLITVNLVDGQRGAGWSMNGDAHGPGLLRGFLREADADKLLLPADLPLIGGQPISSILPGGTGSCATGDDRDQYQGESGWWFYFEYQAEEIAIGH